MYNPENPELLKDVVQILKKDPIQLNALKRSIMDDVLSKTTTPDGFLMLLLLNLTLVNDLIHKANYLI